MKNLIHQLFKDNAKAFEDFPIEDPQVFKNWCAQTHYHISHLSRLIAMSAAFLPHEMDLEHTTMLQRATDGSQYYDLALKDLKKMHCDLMQYPELNITKGLYFSQFELASSPMVTYGYSILLESVYIQFGSQWLQRLKKNNLKSSFLDYFANQNPENLGRGFNLIQNLSEESKDRVFENCRESFERYLTMLEEIKKAC